MRCHWVLLAVVLLLGACGVPTEGTAEVRDPDDVPFALLDEQPERRTGQAPGGTTVVELFYWADESEVVFPVARRIDSSSVRSVLTELDAEPTEAEAEAGLRNPLADANVVSDVIVDDGVAIIDLAESFTDITGADQQIAIAQLVYTATARPGVGQVTFTLEDQPVEVPTGDGSLTSGTVSREDYDELGA